MNTPLPPPSRKTARGQILVVVPFMMLILVGAFMMTANLHQLARQKVQLQIAADAAARAGAMVQATALTGVSNFNFLILIFILIAWAVFPIPFGIGEVLADIFTQIAGIFNSAQSIIVTAAPFMVAVAVFAEGLQLQAPRDIDARTWTIPIPDTTLFRLGIEKQEPGLPTPAGEPISPYKRKTSNDPDSPYAKVVDLSIPERVTVLGLMEYKPLFPTLPASSMGTHSERASGQSSYIVALSSAKPYYVKTGDLRSSAMDEDTSLDAMGWNPGAMPFTWDARLVSFDVILVQNVGPDNVNKAMDKIKEVDDKLGSLADAVIKGKDIWNELKNIFK